MTRGFATSADRLLAFGALVALAPVFAVVALAILLEDGRPIFFRQTRIGRSGRPFLLWKFRSMRNGLSGTAITAGGDPRITRVGALIRRYKVDEFPQFWNVTRGDLRLVGPRPEVAPYVDLTDPTWRAVLSVTPGITDLATLVFRNEEEQLRAVDDPESYYRLVILPAKLALNLEYLERRTIWTDVKLLFLTARFSLFPRGFEPAMIRRHVLVER